MKWLDRIARLAWVPPLLARVGAGLLFLISGWGKVNAPEKFVTEFRTLGIPAPTVLAPFVAWVELLGGGLLILGLLTRVSAFALLIDMVVATFAARMGKVHGVADFLYLQEVQLTLLLLWLVVEGPGRVSMDSPIHRKLTRGPGEPVREELPGPGVPLDRAG